MHKLRIGKEKRAVKYEARTSDRKDCKMLKYVEESQKRMQEDMWKERHKYYDSMGVWRSRNKVYVTKIVIGKNENGE